MVCLWKAVELCVEKGCDLSAVSQAGDTPLNIMLERGRLDCVTGLLCHGACVNVAGRGGNTPLHLAVKVGHMLLCTVICMIFSTDNIGVESKQITSTLNFWKCKCMCMLTRLTFFVCSSSVDCVMYMYVLFFRKTTLI